MSNYYVRHKDSKSYDSDVPTTGPFFNREAAERFMVALANSGKCYEAKIVTDDDLKKEKKSYCASLGLNVDWYTLESMSDDQVVVLFRALASTQTASNLMRRKENVLRDVQKNELSHSRDIHQAKVEVLEAVQACEQALADFIEVANAFTNMYRIPSSK